jgi:ABC-type antimicrobial peptide transport system permease subunit
MIFRDLVMVSIGNLWRMKLRTLLTVSGVVIAIGAFIAMLSFGAGNQAHIKKEFDQLGLFTTMQVYPKKDSEKSDSTAHAPLDSAAIDRLSRVPGVKLVYPYDAFSLKVTFEDSTIASKAQALPLGAIQTPLFSRIVGKPFESDSARAVIIGEELRNELGVASSDSLIGKSVILTVRVSTIDSGLAHILVDGDETLVDRLKQIEFDSLFRRTYLQQIAYTELNAAVKRFMNGFLNARQVLCDTLTVCGVIEDRNEGRLRIESVIVPMATARKFTTSGFSENPADIFAAMSAGRLFTVAGESAGRNYSKVTLDLDPHILQKTIKDSVEALGFRTFSFAEQFEQIQRFFLYFDLGLGVIGLIALLTASLAITNTMVMSILERKREIGVLKSLGADDRDIKFLFLAESGMIGCIGSVAGILLGWAVSRGISAIAKMFMAREGIPPVELFALPFWLIAVAFGVGLAVSIVAGLYPATRAARIDPIEALRSD